MPNTTKAALLLAVLIIDVTERASGITDKSVRLTYARVSRDVLMAD
jgi:hypothetical protein